MNEKLEYIFEKTLDDLIDLHSAASGYALADVAMKAYDNLLNTYEFEKRIMPKVKFSKEDLLARKRLDAGWRTVTVKEITEEVGKNDPTAMNIVATVVVTGGDDDGVTVKCWFSQKPGKQDMLSKFTGSFGKTGNVNVGQEYDLDKCIGQKVQGYCQVDHISGWNKITDWRPVQG